MHRCFSSTFACNSHLASFAKRMNFSDLKVPCGISDLRWHYGAVFLWVGPCFVYLAHKHDDTDAMCYMTNSPTKVLCCWKGGSNMPRYDAMHQQRPGRKRLTQTIGSTTCKNGPPVEQTLQTKRGGQHVTAANSSCHQFSWLCTKLWIMKLWAAGFGGFQGLSGGKTSTEWQACFSNRTGSRSGSGQQAAEQTSKRTQLNWHWTQPLRPLEACLTTGVTIQSLFTAAPPKDSDSSDDRR